MVRLLGIVREHSGGPATYERNESYLFWRWVETIRRQYSEEEIVEELTQVVERIEAYRERYDAESPGAVSLVDSPHEGSIEDVWEELSQWKTLKRRTELLDAARQDKHVPLGESDWYYSTRRSR
jgi:hypothetical protein